ncbi:MAG: class II aldolase/adducin family protein [Lentisphaerae bacterium]|nr:class II aldolase/adducin family protein [Lentisphaerota bacterium]
MQRYQNDREQVAAFMRRLYRQFLTTTSGGNISCRAADGNIVITASQADKGEQTWKNVGVVTPDGGNLTAELKLSIETAMHLAIYAARPDITAIVHAHPVTATFFSAADIPINMHLTAEAYAVAGEVIRIPYALMGSTELADITAEKMKFSDCGLMENHGVITVGKSLLAAFDKLELLENAAKQTLMAQTIPARSLTAEQLAELDNFAGRGNFKSNS